MPRSTAATATIDSTLLRVSREMFRRILGEFPDAAVKVRANASGRMRALLNRLEEVRVRAFDVRPTPAGSRED
jgi:CRP-like cAMP-binding protein